MENPDSRVWAGQGPKNASWVGRPFIQKPVSDSQSAIKVAHFMIALLFRYYPEYLLKRKILEPIKGGRSVECQGQIFCDVECRLQNKSVELRFIHNLGQLCCYFFFSLHIECRCRPVFGVSCVWQFLGSVSDVGLKIWTVSGVGKNPFMGANIEREKKIFLVIHGHHVKNEEATQVSNS